MSPYNVYQGGMPTIYSRAGSRQRGSGFLSALKRFVIPLAKKVIPHVANVVSDISQGNDIKETIKQRGLEAGADVLESAASHGAQAIRNIAPRKRKIPSSNNGRPPSKKYKRQKQSKRKHNSW